jgi:hypothetical protein
MPGLPVLIAIGVTAAGCWNARAPGSDPGPDADADADTDADTDTDSDSDSDTVPEAFGRSFIIHNGREEDVYLRWYGSNAHALGCEAHAGGSWIGCHFFSPWCTIECSAVEEGDYCCIDCDYMAAVQVVPAGGEAAVPWDGTLAEADFDHCSDCECYEHAPAPFDWYVASVEVYPGVSCWDSDCSPDEDGVIWNSDVAGVPTHHGADFDVPPLDAGAADVLIWIG